MWGDFSASGQIQLEWEQVVQVANKKLLKALIHRLFTLI